MKNARLAAAFAAILVALTGCSIEISTNGGGDSNNSSSGDTLVSGEVSTEKSYTYSVDNGDDIKIGVNTSLGYDITSEVPFTISKNGETAFQGSFIYSMPMKTTEMLTRRSQRPFFWAKEPRTAMNTLPIRCRMR